MSKRFTPRIRLSFSLADVQEPPKKLYPEMNWKRYHRLGTIYQFMRDLERRHPDLVKVFSIGQTFDGRDTLVAKLGKAQNYQKPAIFLEGGECVCLSK